MRLISPTIRPSLIPDVASLAQSHRVRIDVGLAVASLLALAVTGWVYADYLPHVSQRWLGLGHDRNAHYLAGARVAVELRAGHLVGAIAAFENETMCWPPFHTLCEVAVLTAAGASIEATVIPSLLGWVGSAILAFLIARRLAGSGLAGMVAGFVTLGFVLSSPDLRSYATDAMLESLGLCLTLVCFHAYLRLLEQPTAGRAAWLGMALSMLFYEKYNYWMLVVISLCVAHGLAFTRTISSEALRLAKTLPWRNWLRTQRRRPWLYLIVPLLAISLATILQGGLSVTLGGRTLAIKNPQMLVTISLGLGLLPTLHWWWTGGRAATESRVGVVPARLVFWAVVPPLIWMLVPRRLGFFVWFLSPQNTEKVYHSSFHESLSFYIDGFATSYHASLAIAVAAAVGLVLALGSLLRRRGWTQGTLALPVFLAIALVLTVQHPNHKIRFLHSWAPAAWILAGVGVASLVLAAQRWAGVRVAQGVATLLLIGFGGLLLPSLGAREFADRSVGSDLSVQSVSDAYLSRIDPTKLTMIVCNTETYWLRWSYYERFGASGRPMFEFRELGGIKGLPPGGAESWLSKTRCETLVFVDVNMSGPLWSPGDIPNENPSLRRALDTTPHFRLTDVIDVHNWARITIWQKR